MALVLLVVLALAGGCYFTRGICRWTDAHGRRTGWRCVLFGTCVTGVLAGALFGLGFLMQPGGGGKAMPVSDLGVAGFAFTAACLLAVVPAAVTVWVCRKRAVKPI